MVGPLDITGIELKVGDIVAYNANHFQLRLAKIVQIDKINSHYHNFRMKLIYIQKYHDVHNTMTRPKSLFLEDIEVFEPDYYNQLLAGKSVRTFYVQKKSTTKKDSDKYLIKVSENSELCQSNMYRALML